LLKLDACTKLLTDIATIILMRIFLMLIIKELKLIYNLIYPAPKKDESSILFRSFQLDCIDNNAVVDI